ncbi:MAG: alpha/beta hydrolase [Oscillochloris sp.]|nr:alpha/beta hydrolase [Oscillochloris sp.]
MNHQLFEPLSHALLPTVLGVTRQLMLRSGTSEHDCRLAEIPIHVYHRPGAPGSDPDLPILLVHGIADNALTWALVLGGLARIGPVYAIDLPGFGLSGYPAGRRYAHIDEHVTVVRTLIEHEIRRPALLVGNSLGGWIGARMAIETPANARGIIMIDPGGAYLAGRPSWEPFIEDVSVPNLRTVRRVMHQMFGVTPLLPALYLGQRGFQTLFQRDAVTHFVSAASEDDFFQPTDLARIPVPCGLIWGRADRFLPAGSFEFFRDNLPDPSILSIPGCGHLPQRERPLQVIKFVRRFAAERVRRAAPRAKDAL